MKILRFVLGDQLSRSISALDGVDRSRDVVLLVEVQEEATYVRHHKQKIVLVLSAMRHFAEMLRAEGLEVDYVRLDDPANSGSFSGELTRAVARHRPDRVVVTEPGEWRVLQRMQTWDRELGIPVEIGEDDRLPAFYWTGETPMRCLRECISATRRNAYAHHIQRLMVTGNFALLAGIDPVKVEEWYLCVYADAFEWVELPNTHGMALYADGGLLASKPYAASGAYIDRMSDYCRGCAFDPKGKTGPKACPFNYLYWHFFLANEERLKSNPRLGIPFRTLSRMPETQRSQIVEDAERFLDGL